MKNNKNISNHRNSEEGGVIYGNNIDNVEIYRSNFNDNGALKTGGVFYFDNG